MSAERGAAAHTSTASYESLADALVDAERCSTDLVRLVEHELLIPADEVEFLARRVKRLVAACLVALPASEQWSS